MRLINRSFISRTLTATLVVATVGVILGLAWRLRFWLAVVALAYLLMLALEQPVAGLMKTLRLPRGGAVVLAYLIFFGLLVAALGVILPALVGELVDLWPQFPVARFAPQLSEQLVAGGQLLREWQVVCRDFRAAVLTLLGWLVGNFRTLATTVVLAVISGQLSLDHERLYQKCYWLTDDERCIVRCQRFLRILERELTDWVVGRSLLMGLAGVITWLVLSLVGVPYSLTLAVLTALLAIVPRVGLALASVPGVMLAVAVNGWLGGIGVAVFYALLHQLDDVVIGPLLASRTTGVNSLVSLLLLGAGWELMGFSGALLAIPFYLAGRAIYAFWWCGREKFK